MPGDPRCPECPGRPTMAFIAGFPLFFRLTRILWQCAGCKRIEVTYE